MKLSLDIYHEIITRWFSRKEDNKCIESETWFFLPGENMKEKSILLLDIEPKRSLLKAPPSKKHVNILPKIKS